MHPQPIDIATQAVNEPDETRAPQPWELKVADDEQMVDRGDVAAAYASGLMDGSTAVARQWIKASPATALAYSARGATNAEPTEPRTN